MDLTYFIKPITKGGCMKVKSKAVALIGFSFSVCTLAQTSSVSIVPQSAFFVGLGDVPFDVIRFGFRAD